EEHGTDEGAAGRSGEQQGDGEFLHGRVLDEGVAAQVSPAQRGGVNCTEIGRWSADAPNLDSRPQETSIIPVSIHWHTSCSGRRGHEQLCEASDHLPRRLLL